MRTSRLFCPTQERMLSARHRSSSRVAVYWARAGLVRKRPPFWLRVWGSTGARDRWMRRRAPCSRGAKSRGRRRRFLAHGVVDDVDAFAARDTVRLLDEVLLGVEDDLVGPRLPGELRLLLGACGPDHGRPPQLRDLDEKEPDTAGRGVHERRLAFLQREGAVRQVVCRHPLEHHGGGDPRLDERGVERHEVLGGGDHVLGVGSRHARERNVVPGRDVIDAFTHGVYLARTFQPERDVAGHRDRGPCAGRRL